MSKNFMAIAGMILLLTVPTSAFSADPPTLDFAADPATVVEGGRAVLTWSTTSADSCRARDSWSGVKPTSGSETVGPLFSTTSFRLDCRNSNKGWNGRVRKTVTVTVVPAPNPPTVNLSVDPPSVLSGESATLSWSPTNATSCTASDGWTGAKAVNGGSEATTALSADTNFTLACTGDGGTSSETVTVTVSEPAPAPTVNLSVDPPSVLSGESATLSWSPTNATSCTAHDGWSGNKDPSGGSESTGELTATNSYTLECNGGGGSAWETVTVIVDDAPRSISKVEAFRFLGRATFGPTEESAQTLAALGDSSTAFERWIDEQFALPPSLQLPETQVASDLYPSNPRNVANVRRDTWFRHALAAEDQLRLRVAFALSEILVVSEVGPLWRQPLAVAAYNDVLVRNAFGNFRELIEEVTLHPAMGVYLSALGNRKPDPALNIRSDENYARELMQLFSIGLVELNPDGTEKLGPDGVPLSTYDQSIIEGFARVFTGWHYAGGSKFSLAKRTDENQVIAMQAYPEEHDTDAKALLDYQGVEKPVLPAGQTAQKDLDDALDNVFNHPNVGPFISKQLIKRLVTSNPSPAYVERVASKFDDDGSGQRGNLAAVVRAILLDPEARLAPAGDVQGKLKEPLLRLTQFWRAYDAAAPNGEYKFDEVADVFGQGPLLSPSVFNFFGPAFAPTGEIADRGLVAPEMEIVTEHQATTVANFFYDQIFLRNSTSTGLGEKIVVIDIDEEVALADDSEALVNRIADKLLAGQISADLKNEVITAIERQPLTKPSNRVAEALYLVVTSPEFAVQR